MLSLPNDPLDRPERLERARQYLAALGLRRYRAIVFGSVARGDFTAESDTDLLVVSDELPVDVMERMDVLSKARTIAPELEPVGWRVGDWRRREANGDPFVAILLKEGVVIVEGDAG
jgi:predicted nucleotidyltransferase